MHVRAHIHAHTHTQTLLLHCAVCAHNSHILHCIRMCFYFPLSWWFSIISLPDHTPILACRQGHLCSLLCTLRPHKKKIDTVTQLIPSHCTAGFRLYIAHYLQLSRNRKEEMDPYSAHMLELGRIFSDNMFNSCSWWCSYLKGCDWPIKELQDICGYFDDLFIHTTRKTILDSSGALSWAQISLCMEFHEGSWIQSQLTPGKRRSIPGQAASLTMG